MFKTASGIIMGLLYVVAGINHFIKPGTYLKIMPPFLPAPMLLVYLSGAAEAILGVLVCIPSLQTWGAWGIIALLIAVFPANIFMFQKGGAAFKLPDWVLLVRLPLQGLLIAWAYWYTIGAPLTPPAPPVTPVQ